MKLFKSLMDHPSSSICDVPHIHPCSPFLQSHAYIYSNHSDSILLQYLHSNNSCLKQSVLQQILNFYSLTISSMLFAISFATNMALLTFTIVALAIGSLHNTGSSSSMSTTIATTSLVSQFFRCFTITFIIYLSIATKSGKNKWSNN